MRNPTLYVDFDSDGNLVAEDRESNTYVITSKKQILDLTSENPLMQFSSSVSFPEENTDDPELIRIANWITRHNESSEAYGNTKEDSTMRKVEEHKDEPIEVDRVAQINERFALDPGDKIRVIKEESGYGFASEYRDQMTEIVYGVHSALQGEMSQKKASGKAGLEVAELIKDSARYLGSDANDFLRGLQYGLKG